MPSWPIASPENTEVTANPSPLTMPTRPFTRARSSSAIISVTQVDRAMPRALSTTAPSRISPVKPRNAGLPIRSSSEAGTIR